MRIVVVLPAPFGEEGCHLAGGEVRSRPSAPLLAEALAHPRASIAFTMSQGGYRYSKFVKVGNAVLSISWRYPTSPWSLPESSRSCGRADHCRVPPMPARVFVALLVTDSGRLTAAELVACCRSARRGVGRCAT